jgi:porphobilinogen deaminase
VAAFAERNGTELRLQGRVVSLDGESLVEGQQTGPAINESAAAALGTALAERLLADGAGAILSDVRSGVLPVVSEP